MKARTSNNETKITKVIVTIFFIVVASLSTLTALFGQTLG